MLSFVDVCETNSLVRKHGFKGSSVNEELSRLVDAGKVIKVDYKGNTSYRNAAKWVKTKTQFYGSNHISSDSSQAGRETAHSKKNKLKLNNVIIDAVKSLTVGLSEHSIKGATLSEIERYLFCHDPQYTINASTLNTVLEKELENKTLHRLQNGEYILLKNIFEEKPFKKVKNEVENICNEQLSNSSEELPASKCDYCFCTAISNKKGEPEELLFCKDCTAKAHPSCLEYTRLLYESYPEPQNWQCPDCKTCCTCDETNEVGDVIVCFICFDGYHFQCHKPQLKEKPEGTWLCAKCDVPVAEHKPAMKKILDFKMTPKLEQFFRSIEHYPKNIPNAKKWTIENVEAFFKFIGFEEEAQAFHEQEIDGLSLLLMKRNDVLTGLGIKLGPALKIYKHVTLLQSKVCES